MKYLRIISILVIALLTVYSFAAENTDKTNYQLNQKFSGKFRDTGTNWQLPRTLLVTEPAYFPYQDPNRSNTQSCPIVLSNGDLLLVWSEPGNLSFSRSRDGGDTWKLDSLIYSTPVYTPDNLFGICTQTGRAIIIWRDTQILELMMSFSDDNGVSWSNPAQITFSGRNERWTSLNQTLDGTLWLFYSDDVPGNARDVFYITSTDNGNSWSSEQPFLSTPEPASEVNASVISADASTLLAFYQDNSSGYSHIYQMTSTDGGLSWSAPVAIAAVYQDEFRPRALLQSNGTFWLIYDANSQTPVLGALQNDIYYVTSSDGGSSWSLPERFTQYVGNDDGHNIALLNNQPFVSFNSWRWADFNQYQIWYGIVGVTTDTNLPPALFNQYVISPYQNSFVTMRAYVDDESGISSVSSSYKLNDVPAGSFSMTDAGDNIWIGQIGPFQVGDNIDFNYQISDISFNTMDVHVSSFRIPYAHTTGNMILSYHENSGLAEGLAGFIWGNSAYWPATDGQDYLYSGGLWVGAQVNGEPRVMDYYYGQSDWQQTPGTFYGMVPGPADQVGKVTYDDQNALSDPVGLQVTQHSYQWNTINPYLDDFIMIRYTIKNTGNSNLDGVSVGLFTDPDLTFQTAPGGATDDLGKYEADRKLAYIYDSQNNPGGYFGVKLLGSFQPHTVIIAPNGGVLDSQDDATRYFSMWTGPQPDPATPSDYRIMMTHALYGLAAGDSQTVAFGIVMGNGIDELRTNADAMELRYAQLFGTQTPPENLLAIDKLNGQVALYWNPGYEPGSTLLSYNIFRTDSSFPIGNVLHDQTHFVDTNVNNDQVYSYYVTAVYNTGESAPSNETTGYPMAVPDEPGKVVSYARPGGRPYGIAFDGNSVWMSNYSSSEIMQFDPATWQWQGSIPAPGGQGCYGMAWDGSTLWVASRTAGGVYQIDLSGNVLQFLDVPPGINGGELLTGLGYENGHVWVMDRNNFIVHKYDASNGSLIQSLSMPPEFNAPASPQGLAYLPDQGTFIVGVLNGNLTKIYEVTMSDLSLTGREFDFGMEYDPGNNEFYSSIRGGLALNSLTGNYWIGDVWTDVIYEVLPFPPQNNDITFQVDMRVKMQQQLFQPANGDIVVVRGSFNGWSGNNEILADPDNDGIYTGTYNVSGNAGEEIQYKFVISYPGGDVLWEENIPNRSFILTGNPETLPVVFFDDDLSGFLRQNEINANHWRVQLLNNGTFAQDVVGNGAGGEFPKGSGIYVIFSGGHYLGTMKNGTPSVSQIEFQTRSDYLPGKIINTSPAPLDQLSAEFPLMTKNKVYVIDSTHSGSDWDNWPMDDGAPVDASGDPLLLSSQDSWTIFNDVRTSVHSGSGDPGLGLEVQRSTYSYTLPGITDAFIVKWKIINKSNNNYADTYFGAWFDPDVDDWKNDLVGTDTILNMGFVYNANNSDAPRAFGVCLLKGATVNGQVLGLTATSGPAPGEDPTNDDERYNLLRGLDRWGNSKQFGPFDFTGDPLTSIGYLDVNPADKRLILSSGPFTLYAGNIQEVVVACIGAVGTDRLNAVAKLKETTRQVQEFYNRPTLMVSQTKGVPKYKNPVYISLNNVKGLLGADLKINYNNSILDLAKADIKLTPLTSAFTLSTNVIQNQGTVSVAIANGSPVETELPGVLIKLPFKVKNNTPAGSISTLIFTEAVLTFQVDPLIPVVPITINGGLEVVTGVLFGDVNQSGAYDVIDAVLILKALVEMYNEITPFQELLADANTNGKLAVNDALIVLDALVLNKPGINSFAGSSADTSVDISLYVPLIQGQIGQQVTFPLSTDDFEQLFGLDVAFQYDHLALRLESIEKTNSIDMLVSNKQVPGQVHLAVINTDGIGNQDDELVNLVFTILAEGDHQITIEKSQGVPSWDEIAHLFIPKEFKLAQNYPNPFNPTTTIKYQLPKPEKVKLEIYNIRGQRVETLVNEYKDAGYYSVEWNASRISTGVYFYRLTAGEFTSVRKCVFVK